MQAYAADVAPAKPTPGWWDTFTVYGVDRSRASSSTRSYPSNGLNFGSLFTDKANPVS